MRGCSITVLEDESVKLEFWGNGQEGRMITLIPGNEYVVVPGNPNATKHRNRHCIFKYNMGTEAVVKFTDTKRTGKVDIADLADLSETELIQKSQEHLAKKKSKEKIPKVPALEKDIRLLATEFDADVHRFRGHEVLVIPKTMRVPSLPDGGFYYKILGHTKECDSVYMLGGPRAVLMGMSHVIGYVISVKPIEELRGEKMLILNHFDQRWFAGNLQNLKQRDKVRWRIEGCIMVAYFNNMI